MKVAISTGGKVYVLEVCKEPEARAAASRRCVDYCLIAPRDCPAVVTNICSATRRDADIYMVITEVHDEH